MDVFNSLNTLGIALPGNEFKSKMFFEHITSEQAPWVNDMNSLWTVTIALHSNISLSLLHAFPQVLSERGIVGG